MLRRITNIVESTNEISSTIRWTVPSHHNEFDLNLSKIEVLRESLIVTKRMKFEILIHDMMMFRRSSMKRNHLEDGIRQTGDVK